MAEFIKQGTLSITGTLLHTGDNGQPLSKIFTLSFNNPAAYVITLQKYDAKSATSIILYEINLSAGDTVNDTLVYSLNKGDTLTAFSDITGTSYYVYGIDYGSN